MSHFKGGRLLGALRVGCGVLSLLWPLAQVVRADDESCEACHDVSTSSNSAEPLAHEDVECVDCHEDLRDFDAESGEDHATPLAPAACADCHESSADEWRRGVHAHDVVRGHAASACADCHGSHDIVAGDNRRSRVHPLNVPDTCEVCHRPDPPRDHPAPGGEKAAAYETSVHGRALRESGLVVTATCVSCHGSHEVLAADDPKAATSRRAIPTTCGRCHVGILDSYLEGVHGSAFEKGIEDVPVCNDCHREHAVKDPTAPGSSVSPAVVAETCARCHADEELTSRYALKATVWASWGRSYHGIASGYGASGANCASCHGYHDVFASSDPRSSVHPAKLEETCGRCHTGASAAFTRIPVHSLIDRESNFASWLVRRVYAVVVVGLIGSFALFVLVDLFGRLRIRAGLGPPETLHVDPAEWPDEDVLVPPAEKFERMSTHARLQHGILVGAFLLLVATGLPVFLHDSEWLRALLSIEGGYRLRSRLHRLGAVLLIALSTWHVALVIVSPAARRYVAGMWIRARDVGDFAKDLAFSLGIAKQRPAIGRYGLVEKLEYCAVVWGNAVMIATGIMLWKPGWFLAWMPVWTFDVCRVVHGFEATLALLAIIVWHMYHVHMKPGVFPMNPSWITGRISRSEMRREHPEEYLKILTERRRAAERSQD